MDNNQTIQEQNNTNQGIKKNIPDLTMIFIVLVLIIAAWFTNMVIYYLFSIFALVVGISILIKSISLKNIKNIIFSSILIVIVIGLHLLTQYFYGVEVDKEIKQMEAQNNIILNNAEQTKDWLTYNDDKYNFSIKYPDGWTISKTSWGNTYAINFLSPETVARLANQGSAEIGSGVQISVSEKNTEKQKYYDLQLKNSEDKKITVINGKTAQQWSVLYAMGNPYSTMLENNNLYFEINDINSDYLTDGIYNNFLSTFQIN